MTIINKILNKMMAKDWKLVKRTANKKTKSDNSNPETLSVLYNS